MSDDDSEMIPEEEEVQERMLDVKGELRSTYDDDMIEKYSCEDDGKA